MNLLFNNFDVKKIKTEKLIKEPFPYFYVDGFLDVNFAEKILETFPSFEESLIQGKNFNAYKEKNKTQITDSNLFPEPIKKLNNILSSDEFVNALSEIFEIPDLIADPELVGGGIHQTSNGGKLDVHVDFNYMKKNGLYRRINVLVYFNKDWLESYGGFFELWDENVENRLLSCKPDFNRMCCFLTNEISFHGVTEVKCPENITRRSYAAYYYTKLPPNNWSGSHHSTIFKPRPNERYLYLFYNAVEKFKTTMKSLKKIIKNK